MAVDAAPAYQLETRISTRARRLRIEVRSADAVRLVLPQRCSMAQAQAFLAQHRDWIERQRQRLQARPVSSTTSLQPWDGYSPLPFQGRWLPVEHGQHRYKRPALRLHHDTWHCLSAPDTVPDAVTWTRLARKALLQACATTAETALQAASVETGLHASGLRISDTRAQWGSCSARGVIQLCWRLICAPPEVMRYVIIHELCHLRQRNHSPRFWALVATFCPAYASHRSWLRHEGPALMRLLPLP